MMAEARSSPQSPEDQAADAAQRVVAFVRTFAAHECPTTPVQQGKALWGLVALCVRHYQVDLLTRPLLTGGEHGDGDPFQALLAGPMGEEGQTFGTLAVYREQPTTIHLSDGLIWTGPWA